MQPILQDIKDLIQAKITSKINPTANPVLVLATDEAAIMNDTVDAIDVLFTPPESNFTPYDPEVFYSNAEPDYVSFDNETWEYVNATPTAGIEPGTNEAYWVSVSSNQFTHKQNTDTHTNGVTFEVNKQASSVLDGDGVPIDNTGVSAFIFGGKFGGGKAAIRMIWNESAETPRILQYTASYVGLTSGTWKTFTSAEDLAVVIADLAALDDRVVDLETFAVTASDELLLKANKDLAINTRTSNYTLVLTDAGGMVRMNMATANTITIPPDSSVAWGNAQIVVSQAGTGQTTIVAGAGVTVNSYAGKFKTAGQYAGVTMVRVAANTWTLFGNLSS